jgi:hypothetical protein
MGALQRCVGAVTQLHHFENAPYSPGWFWITISGHTATKARGIEALRAAAGEVDRVVVFGDQLNDLSMFAAADHAVAVANAHPDVKAAADEVIGPNTSDAVVRWIEDATRP